MEDKRSADPPTPGKCTRTKSVCLEKESYYYTVINHEKLYLNTFKKNKHTYIYSTSIQKKIHRLETKMGQNRQQIII